MKPMPTDVSKTTMPPERSAPAPAAPAPSAPTPKTLSVIIPSYNMETYLPRCVSSLLALDDTSDLEILIVDDGSKDGTLALARALEATYPGIIRAIHQENKGHGGAVNTGVENATGMYVKVVDADDWLGTKALEQVMATLRDQAAGCLSGRIPIDMLVTNYIYDKQGKRHKHTVSYRRPLPDGRVIGWDEVGKWNLNQYLLMHALIFRTQVLRDSRLRLPEHTFYVDFIYAYQPLPWVRTFMYLDVDLYHYFIGRDGQSVQTDVMVRRTDQLLRVNRAMVEATPEPDAVSPGVYRYMLHFLSINCTVTSVFLILSRDRTNYAAQRRLFADIEAHSARVGRDVRRRAMCRAINLPGKTGRALVRFGYRVAEATVGFN